MADAERGARRPNGARPTGGSNRSGRPARDGDARPRRDGDARPQREGYARPQREGYGRPQRDGDSRPRREGDARPQHEGYGRPQRDGDSRPRRDGESRPRRDGDSRPQREGFGRPQRDGDSRPRRDGDSRPQREGYGRPQREGDSRPRRDGDSRPRRDGDSRPQREGYGRPQRDGDSRPRRDGDARPQREGYGRPQRDGDSRPRRDGDSRPRRDGEARPWRDDDRRPPRDGESRSQREKRAATSYAGQHQDPELPDQIGANDLDFGARAQLKTLSKENAERVARHLAAAAILLDRDPELAHRHALAAARTAGRIAVVRETVAITAYETGDYALALRELRTYRRISGRNDHIALIVDSERGLGRTDRALEEGRAADRSSLPVESRVALAIAMSGARLDLGQPELALAELEIPELQPDTAFSYSPMLFHAYAEVLGDLGRERESADWRRRAEIAEEVLDAQSGDEVMEIITEFEDAPARPAASAEPVENVDPVEYVDPVEVAEPIEDAEPAEDVEPSESVEPVAELEPADALESEVEPDAEPQA